MKTDRALTMEECLNEWCGVPARVEPPAWDARHIPIAEKKDEEPRKNERSCNCDRWGHPCTACAEAKIQRPLELPISLPVKQLT